MMRLKAFLALLAALAFAIAPFFATSFRGYDQGAFPVPVIDPPIQPAGWAFSIWGLIYLVLLAHAAVGLRRHAENPQWDAARWPLILSLALGTAWLEVAQRAPVPATLQIWGMWAAAVVALSRASATSGELLRQAPLALYAGWLTAAAGVASGVVLIGQGWLVPLPATLAMLVLIAALALGVMARLRPSPAYGAAVIWALVGIIVANIGAGWAVVGLAALAAVALAAAMIRMQR